MNGARVLVTFLLTVLVAAGVVTFDQWVVPPSPSEPAMAPARVTEPVAGSFVCAVGWPSSGTQLTIAAARPGSTGPAPAAVQADRFGAGETTSHDLPPVFPHTDGRIRPAGDRGTASLLRWSGAPVAAWREWRWTEAEERPAATVAGGCARASGDVWLVPGMSTVGGEEARLRIANPSRSDATIAVSYRTPQGSEEPIALQNLSVEARGVREIVVDELLPERADLAAVVEVRTGRVAVEGYQIVRSDGDGITGASLLAGTTEASEAWTIPWVTDGDERASWLWVLNPGDRTANVEVTMHTGDGGEVPSDLAEVAVPPGRLRRIDLRGTFPDGAGTAAVTARSNGVPVVVSAGVSVGGDEPSATGFAVELGAGTTSTSWVATGGPTAGRSELLRVVNPAGEPATYSVAFFDGVTVRSPEALQEVTVAPGAVEVVDVVDHLGDVARWSAFVTTSEGEVVVGRLGNGGEDAWHLVAPLAVPASRWAAPVEAMPSEHQPGLLRRLGTDLGVATEDGSDPTVVDPAATP